MRLTPPRPRLAHRFATAFLSFACVAALPLAGCGGGEPESVVAGSEVDDGGAPAAGSEAAGGGIAPVRAADGGASAPAGAPPVAATAGAGGGTIRWDLPEDWSSEPPANAMRLAQASIPGDAGSGLLTVFHFATGTGGSTGDNIDRWIGQVEVEGDPERDTFTVGDAYTVTWVDVAGTLKPSMMGTGPAEAQPDSRLLGAVVEGPGGRWFFKATGPDATLVAARDDFRALLDSIEPAG